MDFHPPTPCRRRGLSWAVWGLVWLVIGGWPLSITAQPSLPNDGGTEPVRFGVLSFRPKPEVAQRWQPLADHLSAQLSPRSVQLIPLSYPELRDAVSRREVDLVLTQPAHYVALSVQKNLYSPLATLVELEHGQPMAHFGGVFITRVNHPDIHSLPDIKGHHVGSSVRDSLGSFQSQAYELWLLGIRPGEFRVTEFGTVQDPIVDAVLQGQVDVGFVRTGLLEQLEREGRVALSDLRILRSDAAPDFPLALSTRLYPQWALAAMPWLDAQTARRIAGAVLSLPHGGEVAQAVRISGSPSLATTARWKRSCGPCVPHRSTRASRWTPSGKTTAPA